MTRVFISYKSEDANIARALAERLISQGIEVWFAEYQVLLTNYDDFQSAIDKGIDQATLVLLLADERWLESDHCKYEARRAIDRLPIEQILLVRPPLIEGRDDSLYQHFPELRPASTLRVENKSNAEEQILRFLSQQTGLTLDRLQSDVTLYNSEYVTLGDKYDCKIELRPGVFMATPIRGNPPAHLVGLFSGELAGCEVSMGVFASPGDPAIDRLSISQKGSSSDRRVYDAYRTYALHRYIGPQGLRERGLHLFFRDGRSHLATTYSYPKSPSLLRSPVCWERRYAVTVGRHAEDEFGEVDIVFSATMSPDVDDKDCMAAFCKMTDIFDRVVMSLKYTAPAAIFDSKGMLTHYEWPFALKLPKGSKVSAGKGLVLISHAETLFSLTVEWSPVDEREGEKTAPLWLALEEKTQLPDGTALVIEKSRTMELVKFIRNSLCASFLVFLLVALIVWMMSWPMDLAVGSAAVFEAILIWGRSLIGTRIRYRFNDARTEYIIIGPYGKREQVENCLSPLLTHGLRGGRKQGRS